MPHMTQQPFRTGHSRRQEKNVSRSSTTVITATTANQMTVPIFRISFRARPVFRPIRFPRVPAVSPVPGILIVLKQMQKKPRIRAVPVKVFQYVPAQFIP